MVEWVPLFLILTFANAAYCKFNNAHLYALVRETIQVPFKIDSTIL